MPLNGLPSTWHSRVCPVLVANSGIIGAITAKITARHDDAVERMNTKQLVVIWYAGLAIATTLLFYAAGQSWMPWALLAVIVTIAALFVYTFRPHPAVNKKMLILFVATPTVVLLLIIAVGVYIDQRPTPTRSSLPSYGPVRVAETDVELFDMRFGHTGRTGTLYGRVRNNSNLRLSDLDIKILILDESTQIDGKEVRVTSSVPPGEVRGFKTSLYFNRELPEEVNWSYQLVRAQGYPVIP